MTDTVTGATAAQIATAAIASHAARHHLTQVQRRFRRGLVNDDELEAAEAAVTAAETVNEDETEAAEAEPITVAMDQLTESALEYLLEREPQELGLTAMLSQEELLRAGVCRWAAEAGWPVAKEISEK